MKHLSRKISQSNSARYWQTRPLIYCNKYQLKILRKQYVCVRSNVDDNCIFTCILIGTTVKIHFGAQLHYSPDGTSFSNNIKYPKCLGGDYRLRCHCLSTRPKSLKQIKNTKQNSIRAMVQIVMYSDNIGQCLQHCRGKPNQLVVVRWRLKHYVFFSDK